MPTTPELLRLPLLASLSNAMPVLRNQRVLDARSTGPIVFEVVVESNQLTRVGHTLTVIDQEIRRALALLEGPPRFTKAGTVRPLSPVIAGLVFVDLSVASYHGKHELHGKGRTFAQEHPWMCGVLCSIFAGYVLYYLPMVSDVGPGGDVAPPTGPTPPAIEITVDGTEIDVPLPLPVAPDCELVPSRRGVAENKVRIVVPTDQGDVVVTYSAR